MKETWIVTLEDGIHVERYYGRNGEATLRKVEAKPFSSCADAIVAGDNFARSTKFVVSAGVQRINESEPALAFRIRRRELKFRAKTLFGLSARTPLDILADRYEDEGMIEEATLLRTRYKGRLARDDGQGIRSEELAK